MIGAPALSAAAKELEQYGNEKNLTALKEKTPQLLAMYRGMKQTLFPYMIEAESQKEKVPVQEWITTLQQMHDCMEQFDLDGVDAAMKKLDGFQTPEPLKGTIETLRVAVADVAMEEVMNQTETMVHLLKE